MGTRDEYAENACAAVVQIIGQLPAQRIPQRDGAADGSPDQHDRVASVLRDPHSPDGHEPHGPGIALPAGPGGGTARRVTGCRPRSPGQGGIRSAHARWGATAAAASRNLAISTDS